MISIEEATNIVMTGLGAAVERTQSALMWRICSERMFVNDYVPMYEAHEYEKNTMVSDSGDLRENAPYDGPYDPNQLDWDNTVFAIVKIGGGKVNKGVMISTVTITVLTCNHTFEEPRAVLTDFIEDVNFEYRDGVIQSYLPPSVGNSMQEIYNGFRALISVSGEIKIPVVESLLFVTNIYYKASSVRYGVDVFGDLYVKRGASGMLFEKIDPPEVGTELVDGLGDINVVYTKDGTGTYLPVYYKNQNFITYSFGDQKMPDPQAFLDDSLHGVTQALNRQSTITLSFSTYLFSGDEFTNLVMSSLTNQNVFIDMAIRCSGKLANDEARMWYKGSMVLTGHTLNGELGEMVPFVVSMSSGGYENGGQ